MESLKKRDCTLLSGVKLEEITDRGLVIVTREGERRTLEADSVVPALPLGPNAGLFESLKGKIPEIYPIGGSRQPHLILEAVSEGFSAGLTI
ncbi:MAG: hypothetical protein HY673_24970 [Chloroflexi bacterium]|nr:hypothetical protein [Chloroflexota bacterium]